MTATFFPVRGISCFAFTYPRSKAVFDDGEFVFMRRDGIAVQSAGTCRLTESRADTAGEFGKIIRPSSAAHKLPDIFPATAVRSTPAPYCAADSRSSFLQSPPPTDNTGIPQSIASSRLLRTALHRKDKGETHYSSLFFSRGGFALRSLSLISEKIQFLCPSVKPSFNIHKMRSLSPDRR